MASYIFQVLFSTFDISRRRRAEHALPVDLTLLKTLRLEHVPSESVCLSYYGSDFGAVSQSQTQIGLVYRNQGQK